MSNIRSSRVVQSYEMYVVRIQFVLAFYKLFKNEELSVFFPFSAKCFDKSLKYFLEKFSMLRSLEDWKHKQTGMKKIITNISKENGFCR